MKKRGLVIGLCLLFISVASYGFAWGPSQGAGCPGARGTGPGVQAGSARGADLTDDQQEKLEALRKKYIDETVDLRISINSASERLALLLETSKPDRQAVKKLVKEISDLQAKLADKQIDQVLDAKQIAPGAGNRYDIQGVRGQFFGRGYCRE